MIWKRVGYLSETGIADWWTHFIVHHLPRIRSHVNDISNYTVPEHKPSNLKGNITVIFVIYACSILASILTLVLELIKYSVVENIENTKKNIINFIKQTRYVLHAWRVYLCSVASDCFCFCTRWFQRKNLVNVKVIKVRPATLNTASVSAHEN